MSVVAFVKGCLGEGGWGDCHSHLPKKGYMTHTNSPGTGLLSVLSK